jgi:hypothetical protein
MSTLCELTCFEGQPHRQTKAELRGAIYWLLQLLGPGRAASRVEAYAWLRKRGYGFETARVGRILARKRVPR